MVTTQLEKRGIRDEKVLAAFRRVKRHEFVGPADRASAYGDRPVHIGSGQTISQPYMVALMTEKLQLAGDEKVLEIGTGSGFQAAILAQIAKEVVTVERIRVLYERSENLLDKLGYENVTCIFGDGTQGYREYAPYDRIIVTAGAPDVARSYVSQLAEGGLICIPVGDRRMQHFMIWRKVDG